MADIDKSLPNVKTSITVDPQEEIVLIGMIQNNDIGLSLQIQRAARAAIYQ